MLIYVIKGGFLNLIGVFKFLLHANYSKVVLSGIPPTRREVHCTRSSKMYSFYH